MVPQLTAAPSIVDNALVPDILIVSKRPKTPLLTPTKLEAPNNSVFKLELQMPYKLMPHIRAQMHSMIEFIPSMCANTTPLLVEHPTLKLS